MVKSIRGLLINFLMIWPWCTTLKTWKDFLIIHPTYSIYPFSPLTTHITHDGDGFEQVDPFLTIYKKNKSYLPKVSSNYSLLSILVSYWFNRRRVLDWVTPVTFDSSFFLFRTHSHPHSPKHSSLLIFVYHQLQF